MKTLDYYNFFNLTTLLRVDFNVPVDKNFKITDNTRIISIIPTINKILNDGGKIVLISHFGRPKYKLEKKYSFKNIISEIIFFLKKKIIFIEDCIGYKVENIVNNLKNGEIVLLENLRFYKEEQNGDINFCKKLFKIGDIYVNEAFSASHRKHSSTFYLPKLFKKKCIGYLFEKEINGINNILKNGKKPLISIIGGAKVSTKISVIENIINIMDYILIGGGMAYTFIKYNGGNIGSSLLEKNQFLNIKKIFKKLKNSKTKIIFPKDVVASKEFSDNGKKKIYDINNIKKNWQGLDIGPKTIDIFSKYILLSKTILWNGPLGVFELSSFSKGTFSIAKVIAKATKNGAFSLIGGGDSISAIKKIKYEKKFSFISTGGGAMLEMLEGKNLICINSIIN
ncbi:phosphoglycerate kinase [Candidatus Shikimatogenerans silvanidophilus]|uniref:phosphoglycerate kinase n=1 Tax=Candidatus Shikimatogenerans silvanidophilus TaxID=2782547 RepID=UPI001BA8B9FC|nr:phosphoglycerate kinase [Candidatus Shikimatogenerans silvanidophilus]